MRLFTLIPIISVLLSCNSLVGSRNDYAFHATAHFGIYYEEKDFSFQEVQASAQRKERILARINDLLEIDFDGFIRVYLMLQGRSWAASDLTVYESRSYVLGDDGHEIVHVVSRAAFGPCQSRFLQEGLAMSLELDFENTSIIERYLTHRHQTDSIWGNLSPYDTLSIASMLRTGAFDYSYPSYLLSGAFVKYLTLTHGIGAIKELYAAAAQEKGIDLERRFLALFANTVEEEVELFNRQFPTIGQPTNAVPSRKQIAVHHEETIFLQENTL